MKGEVISYGSKGDPIVKPERRSKKVVLKNCSEKPPIGSIVRFDISYGKYNVDYGILKKSEDNSNQIEGLELLVEGQEKLLENSSFHIEPKNERVERYLKDIQTLWDKKFVPYMSEDSKTNFQKAITDLKCKFDNKDYKGAKAISHEYYEQALFKSDYCEGTKIGFNWFDLFHQFDDLTNFIGVVEESSKTKEAVN
jgi:hypothetical protein